jgi:ankyrin repeat protein
MIRLLLEYDVSPSFDMLRRACREGNLEAVRMLVDTGIDINQDDGDDAPLLHVAASHVRSDVVQYLIERGANVMLHSTIYGNALIAALEECMTRFLLCSSHSKSCRALAMQLPLYRSPLSHFTNLQKPGYKEVSDCEKMVRSLFDAGEEMDTTTRSFGNALHLASYMGSEIIVRHLLEKREDVNVFGGYFESPLIATLKGDHPTIAELLLDRGIEVNRSSPEHVLHYTAHVRVRANN